MSEAGASEVGARLLLHAFPGSMDCQQSSPLEYVEWSFGWDKESRDVGAFTQDRGCAQHDGHDHQLDVADAAFLGGT